MIDANDIWKYSSIFYVSIKKFNFNFAHKKEFAINREALNYV